MNEKEIGIGQSIAMGIFALLFDTGQGLVNLVPYLGQILSSFIAFFSFMTFWLWFKMNGVSYGQAKRVGIVLTTYIISFIPILNILPEITLGVIGIIMTTRAKKILNKIPGGENVTKAMGDVNKV